MSFCGVSRGAMLNSQMPDSSEDGYPFFALSLGENMVNCPGFSRSGVLFAVTTPSIASSAFPF